MNGEQILAIARTNTTGWFELKATVLSANIIRPFFHVKVGQSSGIKVLCHSSLITSCRAFDQKDFAFSLSISSKKEMFHRFIFFPLLAELYLKFAVSSTLQTTDTK